MNHLLSAIMPTHAAIAAALPSVSAISNPGAETDGPILAKYIILERDGREFPILFPAALQHSQMLPPNLGRPVSAGFYQFISAELILAGGESTTLNLRARVQDADIIKRHLIPLYHEC